MAATEIVQVWAIPTGTHYHRSKACAENAGRGIWTPTQPDEDWLRTLDPCRSCSTDTKLGVVRRYA